LSRKGHGVVKGGLMGAKISPFTIFKKERRGRVGSEHWMWEFVGNALLEKISA